MKTCKKCGETKQICEFQKEAKGVMGVRGRCKDCEKEIRFLERQTPEYIARMAEYKKRPEVKARQWGYTKKYRETESGKAKFLEARKRYYEGETFKNTREEYKSREYVKEADRRMVSDWRDMNPEKRAAHIAVYSAIRRGDLVRQPCEFCGETKVDAHHSSYLPEHHLDVVWLCRKHHLQLHKELEQCVTA
jgi:hypothetical protein